uniref:Alpha/beta hydrolase fold-3 domain-containing protein n=1 Tax=Psilocybe cubensis TaxID=181762 RepID=A0A8H8CR36_PSICU
MSPWFFSSKRITLPKEQPTQRSPAQSLLHYETGSPPPSARVDPKLKLQPRRPLRLWDYWKFGFIVAAKATEVTSDVVSHHIWGPRRKSWGIEMTIVTSLIRGAERHSAMVDIGTIRMLMGIGGLVPLPSDALVSPVTFRVKKLNLRGILADFDAKETGQRELSGEWVVGRKTWQRMQTEWKASNKPTVRRSHSVSSSEPFDLNTVSNSDSMKRKERVILYIHGGAYYLSSAAAQRIISIPLAKYTDSRVFAVDYRLAPETCFPGPLHDVVIAYLRLVEDLHIPPENIIICGDSAGGGLTLALLMYLRDNCYTLPSGAILMSPWVDLTMSCESWDSNATYDVVPFPTADNHMNPIALYLGEHTEEYLTHPYASPLFGDFRGLPPLLVQAGDAEVLRDEITLLAHKATMAGVQVMHELYEDAIHVFQAYPFLDASRRSFESMRNFVRDVLPKYQSRSPQLLASIAELGMEREIETERSVFVGGDGLEEKMQDRKLSVDNVNCGKDGGIYERTIGMDDSEDSDTASWVRSPAWSSRPLAAAKGSPINSLKVFEADKGDFEHIENSDVKDVPYFYLSPPIESSLPRHSAPVLPSRPTLSTFLSNSSTNDASSPDPSPAPISDERGPRRIQSTSSLLKAFSSAHDQQLAEVQSSQPHYHSMRSPIHRSFGFNLFSSTHSLSAKRQRRSRSTASLIGDTTPPPSPLPSPSIRKRRLSSALAMTSCNGSKTLSTTEATASAYTDDCQEDIKTLVDEWTRTGPANQTVVVSAHPSIANR